MESLNTGSLEVSYRTERVSEWEQMLQKEADTKVLHCIPPTLQEPHCCTDEQFSTGSKYRGQWDELGISGDGRYTFPNGVIYVGEFFDGMFDGSGELQYPGGAVLRGRWRRGDLLERTLFFADGLQYKEVDWEYCTMPDRRFTVEYNVGLQPARATYRTASQPTPLIPPGCRDTVDGFYDPRIKMVVDILDPLELIRAPSEREQAWIESKCRRAEDVSCGARPDLYEVWEEPERSPPPSRALSVHSDADVFPLTPADE